MNTSMRLWLISLAIFNFMCAHRTLNVKFSETKQFHRIEIMYMYIYPAEWYCACVDHFWAVNVVGHHTQKLNK